MSEKFPQSPPYKDPVWAVLFLVHMVVVAYVGLNALSSTSTTTTAGAEGLGHILSCIAVAMIVSILWAMTWICVMKAYASCLIQFTLLCGVALSCIMALIALSAGLGIVSIFALLCAVANIAYYCYVKSRIPFSTMLLTTVSHVVNSYPATVYCSLASLPFIAIWMLLWAMTWASVSTYYTEQCAAQTTDPEATTRRMLFARRLDEEESAAGDDAADPCGMPSPVVFLLLVSANWGMQVIKNVVHVTASGTMATWYFMSNAMPASPTWAAFKRSTTTSFGSICLGSLMVSIVKAIHTMVERAMHDGPDIVRCIASQIMSCIERLVELFNAFAFVQVAVYGKDFITAAKDTLQLVRTTGIEGLVQLSMVDGVMLMGAILGGIVTAAVAALYASAVGLAAGVVGTLGFLGFIVGLGLTITATAVVESGIMTLFVCFAEQPEALSRTNPELYAKFVETTRLYLEGEEQQMMQQQQGGYPQGQMAHGQPVQGYGQPGQPQYGRAYP